MEEFEKRLTPRTKIVAITQVSNNLGTINPITEIVQKAHAVGAVVLVDAAQAVAHMPIDVQQLDCDFLVFSSHKMYGPTGVGVLYGKRAFLEKLPPYQVGGGMIDQVTFPQSTYSGLPYKFEAGTPNTANIVALGAAIAWLRAIGWEYIMEHERQLSAYAKQLLQDIKGLRLISTARDSVGILSFTIPNMHHLDVGLLLDAQGIAVRTGHGCAQPLMERLGVDGIVRASIGIYNTEAEMTYFVEQLARIIR
jgi:cysteine desulfurase/selenocysteine lyase